MLLDLRHLATFVMLAEARSFSLAAQRGHMTQPGVSQHIRRLEEALGVSLVKRNRKFVGLTEAGEVLLKDARDILVRVEAAIHAAQRQGVQTHPQLTIGYVSLAISTHMNGIVQRFKDQHPEVRIHLQEVPSVEQEQRLLEGDLQLGFMTLQDQSEPIHHLEVSQEAIVVCIPERHALANKQGVTFSDLRDQPLVTVPPEFTPRWHQDLQRSCRAEGFEPKVVQHALQTSAIIALVAAGVGIGFTIAAFAALPHEGVVMRPFEGGTWRVPVVLAWRSGDEDRPTLQFLSVAREVLGA